MLDPIPASCEKMPESAAAIIFFIPNIILGRVSASCEEMPEREVDFGANCGKMIQS